MYRPHNLCTRAAREAVGPRTSGRKILILVPCFELCSFTALRQSVFTSGECGGRPNRGLPMVATPASLKSVHVLPD